MHTYTGLCMSIHMCIYILCMYEPQRNIRPTLYETFDGTSWDMVGYMCICIYIYTAHKMFFLFILWVSTRQTDGLKGYIYTARWGQQQT